MMEYFIVLLLLFLVFTGYMLGRNHAVHDFRLWVLKTSTFDYSTAEFHPYEDMPGYYTMVFQFWKPLRSYLPKE